ncbi:MAG: 2-iminoacetate synthase ThiH [Candidatus Eisenbacteria bacterium]|uniref:2-iminoacetate synthase ThiH n=1 Tax=Eiseniibacteriota bacterium TaxID=2212470 RepID=A0A948W342_UNCEI|nr:2-iminoacetate synthase ThiH [Candidatus Eisenbacteria bacterium]MBU1949893.1 2-iminoacetate synthase ThiH [Candidatus Eisenbacteria bacterium]MBU2690667.1 2-iminoacetate synthase ThiH [Candidatus Eisenbacteria bacterium]
MMDERGSKNPVDDSSTGPPVRLKASWADTPSPWGFPWEELTERPEWYTLFPDQPPFNAGSLLKLRLLRKKPEDCPRVLRGSEPWPGNLLTSALARHMDQGPALSKERRAAVGADEVEEILDGLAAGETLSNDGLEKLLASAADPYRSRLVEQATAMTRRVFHNEILLYAPLYLSNSCTNLCVYCGFNYKNPLPRVTLSPQEIKNEAMALAASGIRHVLLLTGEAPKEVRVDYIENAVRIVKPHFETVSLEVYPMSTDEYARVVQSGATGLTLYQETYDPELYHEVHQGGRKRNLLWRLEGPERAALGGMSKIGIGSLLGLGDWRHEAMALGLHTRALLDLFPGISITVSFPRLRQAPGGYEPPHPVEDEDLIHMMAVLRLYLPQVGLVLSTRESAAFRDAIAPLLATQVSAGSMTHPGGYAASRKEEAPGRQFDIIDSRSPSEVSAYLLRQGTRII